MITRPAAYLRKSKDAATKADHLSMLMASVKAHGHNGDTVVYDDWARSGDIEKLAARTEWRRLCDAIERGEHDVVFMNSLDRGGRSIEEWLRFIRLCRANRVRVIADGTDYSAPENRDRLIFEAWAAEKELEKAKERSARTKRLREARGDAVTGGHTARYGYRWARAGAVGMDGDPKRIVEVPNTEGWTDAKGDFHPPEPMEPVADALRETRGNVMAAAKLLNQRGVMFRGRPWSHRTLGRVADREGLQRGRFGTVRRRAPSPAPLSRLVECACGQIMTPVRDRRTGHWTELYCAKGHAQGAAAHGPYTARARHVVDFLKAEIHISTIEILKSGPSDVAQRRAALQEKRRRLGMALADDALDVDEYRRRMDAVKRDLDALADEEADEGDWIGFGPRTPLVDWSADDETLGEQLRRVVRVVKMARVPRGTDGGRGRWPASRRPVELRPVAVEMRGRRST